MTDDVRLAILVAIIMTLMCVGIPLGCWYLSREEKTEEVK